MRIDDCIHTFEDLALKVLPEHFRKLDSSLRTPWPANLFSRTGFGSKALAIHLGFSGDFSGCYVLTESSRPVYVGISRNVLTRVRQHMLGRTHFDASLAYAIAQKKCPTKGQRSTAMETECFIAAFSEAQAYLRTLHVAAVQIVNPVELYVFEAFAAMALGTSEWNTFRTH
jgi:predicted GIY-YIG superfamily endonuclease